VLEEVTVTSPDDRFNFVRSENPLYLVTFKRSGTRRKKGYAYVPTREEAERLLAEHRSRGWEAEMMECF
jgi:hypothetical protein